MGRSSAEPADPSLRVVDHPSARLAWQRPAVDAGVVLSLGSVAEAVITRPLVSDVRLGRGGLLVGVHAACATAPNARIPAATGTDIAWSTLLPRDLRGASSVRPRVGASWLHCRLVARSVTGGGKGSRTPREWI